MGEGLGWAGLAWLPEVVRGMVGWWFWARAAFCGPARNGRAYWPGYGYGGSWSWDGGLAWSGDSGGAWKPGSPAESGRLAWPVTSQGIAG